MMRLFLVTLFSVASLLPSVATTVALPTPAAPALLSGQWKGPLTLLGGQIMVGITITPLSNGTYYGALDVPQQRISRMPVAVELNGTDLKLRIDQAGSLFVGKILNGGAKLSGTWTQAGTTAPMVLKRLVAAPALALSKLKMTPPYRESDISFINPSTKQRLAGTLTVPAGEGPFAAVVLISDSGPQNRDVDVSGYRMFGQLADYLTRHGVAVLRFDDRGVGKSGGNYATATTLDFVTDAQAALAALRTRPLISANRVGLLGHGEGANVALLTAAAASPDQAPAFVVSLAGYGQPGYKVMMRQQGEIMRLIGSDPTQVKAAQDIYQRTLSIIRENPDNEAAQPKITALLGGTNTGLDAGMARARAVQLTSPWSRYFFDFDPQAQLAKVPCSVLLVNGTADLQTSIKTNLIPLQKGLRRAHRTATSLRLVGVNHLFQPSYAQWPFVNGVQQATFSPDGLKKICTWVALKTKLPAAPLPTKLPVPTPAAPRKILAASEPHLHG